MSRMLVSLIATSLCVLLPAANGVITVNVNPESRRFTDNDVVTITCSYPTNYRFSHFTHPIYGSLDASRPTYQVQNFNQRATLSLIQATMTDSGSYVCHFYDSSGQPDYGFATLEFVHSVTFMDQQFSFDALVGGSVTLICNAQHASPNRIEWKRYNSVLQSSNRMTVNGPELTISPVELNDAGLYTCTAGNTVSLSSVDIQLSVALSPVAEVSPTTREVELGDSTLFSCVVVGFPEPTVEWVKVSTGGPVPSQHVVSVQRDESHTFQFDLSFSNVTAENIGSYRCQAINSGGMAEEGVILNLIGTLGAIENVRLTIVNQTNILVTWSAPLATVISYTVTWQMIGEDGVMSFDHELTDATTSYLITNLSRTTMYRIFVYGTNEKGRGVDSAQMNITTLAIAPSGQVKLTLFDISPTSTQVVIDFSSVDDGGAHLSSVRLQYREVEEGAWQSVEMGITGPQLLSQLQPETEYELRAQPGNEIGFGSLSGSIIFTTSPEGYPGSPTNVTVRDQRSSSLLVCWVRSSAGRPFSFHTITGMIDGVVVGNWSIHVTDAESSSECVTVSGLNPDSCYQFTVTVTNSNGTGQSSALSQEACTLPAINSTVEATVPSPSTQTTYIIIASVVVGVLLALAVVVLMVLCCCCCVKWRQRNMKYNLPDRRESEPTLMTYQHQSSSVSSSDNSPPTATSTLSNPFIFEVRPSDSQFYYNGTGVIAPMSSHTLGSIHLSPTQQLSPRSTHSLPAHYHPPSEPSCQEQSDFQMIDNPYYKKHHLYQIPENEEHINYAYARVPMGLPPPQYHPDNVSEVAQSEVSFIPMGESYSQPSHSPKLKKKKRHKLSPTHRAQETSVLEDTELTDNNAYEIVPHPAARGLGANGRADLESESGEPRFEIQSTERGAVFETVQFKAS